jgi:hypothetical protein
VAEADASPATDATMALEDVLVVKDNCGRGEEEVE